MSRFDLYRGQGYSDYLLDVQSDFVDFLETRMVIPLVGAAKLGKINPRLHAPVTIDGALFFTVTNLMGAMPAHSLGKPLGNLAEHSHDITAAIDFLLQGF